MGGTAKEAIEGGGAPVKKTPFQSPVPILIKLRNLIFGKERPDIFTQVHFFLNLIIVAAFFSWHLLSVLAINKRGLIWDFKGISVEALIERRGMELGFSGGELLDRLVTLHSIAVICWAVVLIGLVRLYRRKKDFIYFTLPAMLFYLGMNVFYMSYRFYVEDTTSFDKVAVLLAILSSVIHYVLLKRSGQSKKISFFGVDEDAPAYRE